MVQSGVRSGQEVVLGVSDSIVQQGVGVFGSGPPVLHQMQLVELVVLFHLGGLRVRQANGQASTWSAALADTAAPRVVG